MKKTIQICKYCGKEFDPQNLGRRRLYCSPECTQMANNERKRMRKNIIREMRQENNYKERYLKRYAKSHERMNAIAKMQRETGVSYGLLSLVWENKEELARCLARYRRR